MLMNCKVYRVNWLRAKARYDRWNEEDRQVKYEMEWTITWYRWQKEKWMKRSERAEMLNTQGNGHVAYAEKQVSMWEKLEVEAQKAFWNS
jgi:hypothetical protein